MHTSNPFLAKNFVGCKLLGIFPDKLAPKSLKYDRIEIYYIESDCNMGCVAFRGDRKWCFISTTKSTLLLSPEHASIAQSLVAQVHAGKDVAVVNYEKEGSPEFRKRIVKIDATKSTTTGERKKLQRPLLRRRLTV